MATKYTKLLVKNLQTYLDLNGRRAAWLAEKSGIPTATISRLLNLGRTPRLDTIEALAEGLGFSPGELLSPTFESKLGTKTAEDPLFSNLERELIEQIRKLNHPNFLKELILQLKLEGENYLSQFQMDVEMLKLMKASVSGKEQASAMQAPPTRNKARKVRL